MNNYELGSNKAGMFIFRAKPKYIGNHLSTEEWIYGGYWYDSIKDIHYIHYEEIDNYGNICRVLDVEVDEKTIGRYTGLKDKNGKEIYEFDVMKTKIWSKRKWKSGKAIVAFDNGCFILTKKLPVTNKSYIDIIEDDDEVIGNIYDTKEDKE